MTDYSIERLTKALAAAADAFLASLDDIGESTSPTGSDLGANVVTWPPAAGESIHFDPLVDPLPWEGTPDKGAPDRNQRLCSLVYLGSIGRFQAETGQGAGAQEIRRFAIKAGYANGRAVNGWNSRAGSIRCVEVRDGLRYLNQHSAEWLDDLQTDLGIELSGSIKWVDVDEDGNFDI